MLFGQRNDFAVEAHHEQILNANGCVFGRVCVWAKDLALGNIEEPACILGSVQGAFEHLLLTIESLHDPSLDSLGDREAFDLLNVAIYGEDSRTAERIAIDSKRYSKFVFLTNWGEAFDGTNAFLLKAPNGFRILYQLKNDIRGSALVSHLGLRNAAQSFVKWVSDEASRGSIQ
jgi:hypothetical protein